MKVLLVLTRDLFAFFVQQQNNISTDSERRAGLSAIMLGLLSKSFHSETHQWSVNWQWIRKLRCRHALRVSLHYSVKNLASLRLRVDDGARFFASSYRLDAATAIDQWRHIATTAVVNQNTGNTDPISDDGPSTVRRNTEWNRIYRATRSDWHDMDHSLCDWLCRQMSAQPEWPLKL